MIVYVNLVKIAMCAGVLFWYWLYTGLKWGIPPGGGYGDQGGLLFFVLVFGG